ncbi:MAG: toxin-antitoxin system YwqK family antitoxin [Flammeovirgaceae bacterium]
MKTLKRCSFILLLFVISSCNQLSDTFQFGTSAHSSTKFTGLRKSYHPNGKLMSEVNYKAGKRHGNARDYYKTGQLRLATNYQEGKKHGNLYFYHPNGQLYKHTQYINGVQHGTVSIYYANGKPWATGTFADGQPCLGFLEFQKNGQYLPKNTFHVEIKDYHPQNNTYQFFIKLIWLTSNNHAYTPSTIKFYLAENTQDEPCINLQQANVKRLGLDASGSSYTFTYQAEEQQFLDFYVQYTSPFNNQIVMKKRISLTEMM